jgi:squalene-associated FAD-dependent desaturase
VTVRVAVVGGGLAGIAAALACADAGAGVTLYEARRFLGGATFSIERNGHSLDNGQHVALRCCDEYLAFLRRIGSDSLLPVQSRLRIPILLGGGRTTELRRSNLPAPLHLAGALLRYSPLTLRERVRALLAANALRRLDPDDAGLDQQTFGDWLRSHGQSDGAIARLWDLVALPTINLHADDASLAVAVKVFRTGLLDTRDGADIGVPAAPLGRLHGEAALAALEAAGVQVRLGARVQGVEEGARVHADGDVATFDAAIVAVPHTAVAALLPEDAVDAESLRGLGTSPIVNLHVHLDRPVLHERFAAALDSPVQWVFDRTGTSRVAEGQMLAISLSAAEDERTMSVAELHARFLPELERLLPAVSQARVLDVAATHEPQATFAAVPGTGRLRPGTRTAARGIYLAGSWTDTGWPATMESAVRSGNRAAAAVLAASPGEAAPEPALAGGGR